MEGKGMYRLRKGCPLTSPPLQGCSASMHAMLTGKVLALECTVPTQAWGHLGASHRIHLDRDPNALHWLWSSS